MEDDQDTTFTPFWLPATPSHHSRSLRRSTSSLIFSSGGFLLLLVAALAFVFVIVPSLHSFTAFMSHIFKPNSVKKSWDSINLVLVLFAVLCGFLGRNAAAANNDGAASYPAASAQVEEEAVKSGPLTPRQWYEYSDQTVYNDRGANRMRSSSSYPDLRQDSEAVLAGDERWQSYDDTHVSNYQVVHSGQPVRQQQHRRRASWHEEFYDISNHVSNYRIPDGGEVRQRQQQQHRRRASWHDGEFDDVTAAVRPKYIPVDTFVIRTEKASSSSSDDPEPVKTPSPPHMAAPPVEPNRIYEADGKRETINDDLEAKSSSFRQPATAAATQPPPEAAALPENEVNSSQKREKNVTKNKKKIKTGGVATTKQFITSLRRNNKNKKRQKNIEDFETQFTPANTSCPSPIPPPPPPPPPPSVFHTLFQSKKPKPTKTHHPIPHQPSPPSPSVISAARVTSTTSILTTTHKPSLPLKLKTFNILEEEAASNSGSESPLPSGIPPPPPLPPFRMQAMRFVKHGDFVRVKSDKSSDDEEGDVSPMSSRSGFCPSPDVNTKADTFIARFRAGLKLEKMNSVNQRGRSNLGIR